MIPSGSLARHYGQEDFLREFELKLKIEWPGASWATPPRMWDEEDETFEVPTDDPVKGRFAQNTMVLSGDGKFLAVGTNAVVRLYDVETFALKAEILEHDMGVYRLMFMNAPEDIEGSYVLMTMTGDGSGKNDNIHFWALSADGELLPEAPAPVLEGKLPGIGSKVCSHMGHKMLYIPSGYAVVRVMSPFNKGKRQEVCVLNGHYDNITWAAWSPDDRIIATASWDSTYRLWDAGTGEQKHLIHTHGQNWTGVFLNDAKHVLLTGAGPFNMGIYEIETAELVAWFPQEDFGKTWLRVLAVQTARGLVVLKLGRKVLAWYPFRMDGEVQTLWQIEKEKDFLKEGFGGVLTLRFVDAGRKLMAFGEDRSLFVWDMERGVKWRFQRPKGRATGGRHGVEPVFVRRKDGEWIMSLGEGKVRCWKL